jgi:hypothetical protein
MRQFRMTLSAREQREVRRLNRSALRRLLVQERSKGRRCRIDVNSSMGPGIRLDDGSLLMLSADVRCRLPQRRRMRKLTKPYWPLLTMWQGVRLVLLKKPARKAWFRKG